MNQRRVESFLLRLVVETDSPEEGRWRGRVQHVASGRELQIGELDDALAFISAVLRLEAEAEETPAPPSGLPLPAPRDGRDANPHAPNSPLPR